MMRFNDGAANIEPHAHPIGFGAKKWLKHALDDRFCNTAP